MSYKDTLQQFQELRNKIKELLRVITLKNREIKRLKAKNLKLKKETQVDHLKAIIEKLEKRLEKRNI